MPNGGRRKKLVIVGDGGVGKTCLLIRKAKGVYPEVYVPTVFENNVVDITDPNGHIYDMALWDTAGGEEYYRLRPISYPDTDIFLICFDISRYHSFQNVADHWIHEIDYYLPEGRRLLVGCKSDLRPLLDDDPNMVHYSQGRALAGKWDMPYVETSSLIDKGVDECFQEALRLSILGPIFERHREGLFRSVRSKRTADVSTYNYWQSIDPGIDHPDRKPSKANSPPITIEQSRFGEDWRSVKELSLNTDVIFRLGQSDGWEAHAVILCCASTCSYFSNILLPGEEEKRVPDYPDIVAKVLTKEGEDKSKTVLELTPSVNRQAVELFLNFIYSGVPECPDDIDPAVLDQISELGEVLCVSPLVQWCENWKGEDHESNQCLADYWRETMGQALGERFLNKEPLSDVKFLIDGKNIHAHRCVLIARSEMLAAMLGRNFRESISDVTMDDVDVESFLAVLQYLYTDHCDLQHVDPLGVLVLADRFCLPRLLAICERHLGESVPSADTNSARENVISLIHTAKKYNAPQLIKWCLHHIAMDYAGYTSCEAYHTLDDEDKEEVEANKFPPQWYLDTCERRGPNKVITNHYMNRRSRKCVIL